MKKKIQYNVKNTMLDNNKKIKSWKDDLKIKKQIVKDITEALSFPPKSKISEYNLVSVLNVLMRCSKKREEIELLTIKNQLKYSTSEFNSIIKRLKQLGEIMDPYLLSEREGKYLSII
tara:strand:+ start:183 stop:536 length:354 start_codon:yes stop_codon:yes gene_type:complete